MGDALFDLEHVIRSRKEKLSVQETNLLMAWRAQAMRDFTVGFGAGSVVTWLATSRIRNLFRLNITLAAAAACGFWRFGSSVNSCVDRVLSLEGSRIQKDLATILLNKYSNEPWVLQRLSKHFYREAVLEDTSIDKPVYRWRFRNACVDSTDHSHEKSYGEETYSKTNDARKTSTSVEKTQIYSKKNEISKTTVEQTQVYSKKNEISKTTVEQNQVYVQEANVLIEDPFQIMFKFPGSVDDIPRTTVASSLSSSATRREKRLRRRHRRHHQPDSEV